MHSKNDPSPSVCTVVSKNHLAFARTMTDSYLEHHPDGRVHVLFCDDIEGSINPDEERFHCHSLTDLAISEARDMAFQYDAFELSCALKIGRAHV